MFVKREKRVTAHVNGIGRKEKKKQDNERAVQNDRKKGNKMKKKHKEGTRSRKGRRDKSNKASQDGQHGKQAEAVVVVANETTGKKRLPGQHTTAPTSKDMRQS